MKTFRKRFCDYVNHDTKGVEIGIYAASGILFAYAFYRTRPITKFGKALDIPNIFVRDKVRQFGSIDAIIPSATGSPLLLVNHRPPLGCFLFFKKELPIELPGVSVNANGYSWLQTVAVGRKVEFIPISNTRKENIALCQIFLVCPEYKKALVEVSEALLSLGFGKIDDLKIDDLEWQEYFKYLAKVEYNAKHRREGLWSSSVPQKSLAIQLATKKISSLLSLFLPAERRLPELVQ